VLEVSRAGYRDRIYSKYADTHVGWQDTSSSVYRRWANHAAAHLRGWLPQEKGATCLDLGCGPGNVLYMLRELGYSNTAGVDISEAWMPVARQICPNVTQGDAIEYLQERHQQFDLITAFDLIEHLRKDQVLDFLDLLYQALRPGGSIILQTPNAESPWGCMHRYHDLTHELAFDPRSLAHCCRLSGFERFQAREIGPYVHGIPSLARKVIWSTIRIGLMVWNLAEAGSRGSSVYTRVFVARAVRPA
jgi:2-polyprenyl-3-methyl-5-hydroxy-6-metoxy-1,4-benzoquinol methylase